MSQHTNHVDVQRVQANNAVLYTETRGGGRGPAVLLIAGAGGDAGELAGVADGLSDAFTVTTYDRRGNSRSPRPAGWVETSVAEQADDAAALLAALGRRDAMVVGTSAGGSVALELALRHPDAVRAAIVHEPVIMAAIDDPEKLAADVGTLIEEGMAAGGPQTAMASFLRWAAGDAAFESIDSADRDRYLANGEVFIAMEMPATNAYRPAAEAIGNARPPIMAVASQANRNPTSPHHAFYQAASWLARHVGTDLLEIPGSHMAYLTDPRAVAQHLRPLLRSLS